MFSVPEESSSWQVHACQTVKGTELDILHMILSTTLVLAYCIGISRAVTLYASVKK